MKKVFYEKVGRRYKPVSYYDSNLMDAMPKGAHLVVCFPEGGTSTLYNVEPDFAGVLAALRLCEDRVVDVVMKATEARPSRALSPRLQKAFEAYKAIAGDEMMVLTTGSARDVVDALRDELIRQMKKHDSTA